jgi:hypothetical protein
MTCLQSKGGLEYHIPASFTPSRPALSYSHVSFNTPSTSHPLASLLPKPSQRPAVVGDPDAFLPLMHPPGSPTKLSDYTQSDIPQLGLHIVSFDDKTLVTMYWLHTLMDAMGKSALLDAWTLILQGREEEVRVPVGVDIDPLEQLGRDPTERHKLEEQRMGIWGMLSWGLGQLPHLWRKQETRMVCIPGYRRTFCFPATRRRGAEAISE